MKTSTLASLLASAAAMLAGVAAALGLLWSPNTPINGGFTSVHGELITLTGHGLYRLEALFFGAGYRGQDVVTLFMAVPALLFVSWRAWADGAIQWLVLRLGLVTFFAYIYGTMAFGAFYNELFLLYVATLWTSLVALALSARELHARLSSNWAFLASSVPRTGPALLLSICGLFTGFIWAQPLISALLAETPPPLLFHATTKVTEALDLAIVAPSAILAAWLVCKRRLDGYMLAVPLLSLIVMLFPTITASTIS
ncbi:MAG: hypothetical protein ABIY37_14005 [Devosia sp.]